VFDWRKSIATFTPWILLVGGCIVLKTPVTMALCISLLVMHNCLFYKHIIYIKNWLFTLYFKQALHLLIIPVWQYTPSVVLCFTFRCRHTVSCFTAIGDSQQFTHLRQLLVFLLAVFGARAVFSAVDLAGASFECCHVVLKQSVTLTSFLFKVGLFMYFLFSFTKVTFLFLTS